MGDRGNIIINDGDGNAVVLYTHWAGNALDVIACEGLEVGRSRWGDSGYLARIVFDTMTDGENRLTGYGLTAWPHICDNQHPYLVIDVGTQRVGYVEADDPRLEDGPPNVPAGHGWAFDEFVARVATP
jgi:hypothetical protein